MTQVIPGKYLFREVDQRAGELQLPLLSVSQYRGVVPRSEITDDLPRAEDLTNYKVCLPGDLVVNRMSAYQGAMGRSPLSGVVSPDYMVLRVGPLVESRYLHHLFRSAWFRGQVVQRLRGIGSVDLGNVRTPRINPDEFGGIPIPVPPLDEQRRIADFLDAETARIDRIHDLRTRQQTLLEEAAIRRVYDAVRGAHVKGERKESGLDWLGTVPANWRIGAVSHYFEVELGKMLNQEQAQGDYLRPYLRVANVQWDRIDVADLAMMNFPPAEQGRYRLKPGDLLVNEGGSWPGRAAVWNGEISEIYYQKALHRIRARGKELTRWLYYCLVAAERLRVFQVQGNTSTMTHLTREQLRPQRFPFPEIPTQARLVGELDRAASRDAEVKLLLSRQRTLLTERRQALITAAVTGQFDVTTASGRNVTEGVSA
ncbi:Type-1 restriction enzyme EcoKI specificity protein [Streptomyces sp. enrichment culture]|uniref:restriction endonuclease subunit S n=1 Tax=Streptomyces sp. enrichment culture TaxID=1795815 RepID=UPI003F5737ED